MSKILTVADLINHWPTRSALAEAMRACAPQSHVSVHQVHKWAETGSVPAKYHLQLLGALRAAGVDITAERIIELHAPSGGEASAA